MDYKKKSLKNSNRSESYEEIDTRLASGWYVDSADNNKKKKYKTKEITFKISKKNLQLLLIPINNLENINLTLTSDHGARIVDNEDSYLSVIYAYRDKYTTYKEFSEKTSSQKIFSNKYNYLINF